MGYKFFVSTSCSLESHEERCGNNVISPHANVFFIADDNILWHHESPFDNTYSLETLSQECKIGLITYAVPCNGYVFPRFSSFF